MIAGVAQLDIVAACANLQALTSETARVSGVKA